MRSGVSQPSVPKGKGKTFSASPFCPNSVYYFETGSMGHSTKAFAKFWARPEERKIDLWLKGTAETMSDTSREENDILEPAFQRTALYAIDPTIIVRGSREYNEAKFVGIYDDADACWAEVQAIKVPFRPLLLEAVEEAVRFPPKLKISIPMQK